MCARSTGHLGGEEGRGRAGRRGQGRKQPQREKACFYGKLGLSPGHDPIMRLRERLVMNRTSVGFSFRDLQKLKLKVIIQFP